MTRQLPLDLPHAPAFGREDFVVGAANADAMRWLDRWPDWPAPGLVLVGPAQSGKSHAAALWARRADAATLAASALEAMPPPDLLGDARAAVVEDADRGVAERSLLHLYNLLVQRGGFLLATARTPPAQWPVALPDLRSRLAALPVAALRAPDDALLAAVILKLFADRQVTVEPGLVEYLLRRIERSFAAAAAAVAALDRAALAAGQGVTVALARRILEEAT